jgi:pimeloyl-ACP methyl ester carboxylesterase
MSRTARITAIAAAAFLVSGALSGLLLDERAGVLGALEWVLRTLVVVSAVAAVAGGLVLVVRVRRRVRVRPVGWVLGTVAGAAFLFFVAQPVLFGVYLTHLPARRAVHDADLGAPKLPVTMKTAKGLELRGWYVPSRNGAAVAVLHGTGGNRLGVVNHARLLARHGYGVLLFDFNGHGNSDGRSTSLPSAAQDDADAALAYLRDRADVRDGRIGMLGVSFGGEVGLQAAARHPELRATVVEGVTGVSPSEMRSDPASFAVLTVVNGIAKLLVGGYDSVPRADLAARIAPRPLMVLSAGRGRELHVSGAMARRGRSSVEQWNLPGASHASALRTDPAGYERRVVGFLDRALR